MMRVWSIRPIAANESGGDRVLRTSGLQTRSDRVSGKAAMNACRFALAAFLLGGPCFGAGTGSLRRPAAAGGDCRLGTTRWRAANIESIGYMPDGRLIADSHTGICIFDPATGQLQRLLRYDETSIHAIAFSADGAALAVSDHKGISFWNNSTGKITSRLAFEEEDYLADLDLMFADGKSLLGLTLSGGVLVVDATSGKTTETLKPDIGFNGLALSKDGRLVRALSITPTRIRDILPSKSARPPTVRSCAVVSGISTKHFSGLFPRMANNWRQQRLTGRYDSGK